jgi:hypothetical protein
MSKSKHGRSKDKYESNESVYALKIDDVLIWFMIDQSDRF